MQNFFSKQSTVSQQKKYKKRQQVDDSCCHCMAKHAQTELKVGSQGWKAGKSDIFSFYYERC